MQEKEKIIEAEMEKAFLYNPDNIMNCEECPVNILVRQSRPSGVA